MNTKNNKRSQNSIYKLKKTVCKMLKDIDHEKITIKDLCNAAGVNRTTFYAHFDDIESLLYEICEEYIIGCYEIFLDTSTSYKSRIRKMVEFIQEDFEFFAYIFRNVHNLDVKILEMVSNRYTDADFVSGDIKAKLSLAFIISGFVGVGKTYFITNQSNMNPEEFADVLFNAVNMSNSYFVIK